MQKIFNSKNLSWFVSVFIVGLTSAFYTPQKASAEDFSLKNIHSDIAKRYKGVAHINSKELGSMLKSKEKDNILVLDVREADEFSVSHIPGAERVDPGVWLSTFMDKFGDKAKGKKVVLYCSVGVRSSKLAVYVQKALMKKGVKEVYNLEGGIFNWHNESKELMRSARPTDKVHPYNRHWGQLVERTDLISYKPE